VVLSEEISAQETVLLSKDWKHRNVDSKGCNDLNEKLTKTKQRQRHMQAKSTRGVILYSGQKSSVSLLLGFLYSLVLLFIYSLLALLVR